MALQKVKFSNGRIREIQDHLAFDQVLQKQQKFVPCDEKGIPLSNDLLNEKKSITGAEAAQKPPVAAVDSGQEKQIMEAYMAGSSLVEIAKQHGLHWKKVEAVVRAVNANASVR